jgi:hypothetical protein
MRVSECGTGAMSVVSRVGVSSPIAIPDTDKIAAPAATTAAPPNSRIVRFLFIEDLSVGCSITKKAKYRRYLHNSLTEPTSTLIAIVF